MSDAMQEALHNADRLINLLNDRYGVDYSSYREKLATEIWYDGFWLGNDDVTIDIPGIRPIRCIQEDHWDQHMDYEEECGERPTHEKMLLSNPEYTWFADDTGCN